MQAMEMLDKLIDVKFIVDRDTLWARALKGGVSRELHADIKKHKEEMIRLIKKRVRCVEVRNPYYRNIILLCENPEYKWKLTSPGGDVYYLRHITQAWADLHGLQTSLLHRVANRERKDTLGWKVEKLDERGNVAMIPPKEGRHVIVRRIFHRDLFYRETHGFVEQDNWIYIRDPSEIIHGRDRLRLDQVESWQYGLRVRFSEEILNLPLTDITKDGDEYWVIGDTEIRKDI